MTVYCNIDVYTLNLVCTRSLASCENRFTCLNAVACTNKDENDAKRYMTDPNGLGCVAMTCDGIVSRRYMTWRVIAWYRGGIWRDTIAHDDHFDSSERSRLVSLSFSKY
jgi:hypothetical protein